MEQADEDGFKPIHLAVIQGSLETVNLLLANKVDLNALDGEGHSGTSPFYFQMKASQNSLVVSKHCDAVVDDTMQLKNDEFMMRVQSINRVRTEVFSYIFHQLSTTSVVKHALLPNQPTLVII